MKNPKLLAVIIVAVLALAYVVTNVFVGQRIEREVALLATSLTARDDIQVTRMEYERGFRDGVLRYDFTWRPLDADANALRMMDMLDMGPDDGLRMAGTLDMRHGPWVGQGAGFALAGTTGVVALPEPLRPFLPQYPGQAPLLHITGSMTFAGMLETQLELVDYHGGITAPQLEADVSLSLQGLQGTLRTSSRLDRLGLDVRVAHAAIGLRDAGEFAQFSLDDFYFEADMTEARPWVWIGSSRNGLAQVEVMVPEHHFSMRDVLLAWDAWIEGDGLNVSNAVEIGPSRLDGYALDSATLSMSLRKLDVNAVATLAELGERARRDAIGGAGPGRAVDSEHEQAQMRAALQRILAGGPVAGIDELRIAVVAPDDLSGRLELGFDEGVVFSFEAPQALAGAVRAEAELVVSKQLLRHVAGLMAIEQLPPDASPAEQAALAESTYQEGMAGLQVLPFIDIRAEHIAVSAEISDGILKIGGVELMNVAALLGAGA